ncbi:cingulin-like, partial [Mustelus asterias]
MEEQHAEQNATGKQPPLDYGVQIRFINDLQDTQKPRKARKNAANSSSYGVMVRVQGISGQPFVVLNNSDGVSPAPRAQSRPDYAKGGIPEENGAVTPGAWPQSRTDTDAADFDIPENPYGAPATSARRHPRSNSQGSTSDEEAGSKHYVRIYDQGTRLQGSGEVGGWREESEGHGSLPRRRPAPPDEQLRKSRSQSSLLGPDEGPGPLAPGKRADHWTRSSATSTSSERSVSSARGGRQGYLDKPHGSTANSTGKASSTTDVSVKPCEPGAIDTKPLSSVDSLISKFDASGGQQRGRPARHGRLSSDDRRRSRSLDSRAPARHPDEGSASKGRDPEPDESYETPGDPKPFRSGDVMDVCKDVGFGGAQQAKPPAVARESPPRGHLPPQSFSDNYTPGPRSKAAKQPGPFPTFNASSLPRKWSQHQAEMEPIVERSPNATAFTERAVQLKSTPDLLKDQQEVSAASDELTKQLIFKILKEGSIETESFLRKKANLVFDKFQDAKYAELSPDLGTLSQQKNEFEKKIAELQQKLDEEFI